MDDGHSYVISLFATSTCFVFGCLFDNNPLVDFISPFRVPREPAVDPKTKQSVSHEGTRARRKGKTEQDLLPIPFPSGNGYVSAFRNFFAFLSFINPFNIAKHINNPQTKPPKLQRYTESQ